MRVLFAAALLSYVLPLCAEPDPTLAGTENQPVFGLSAKKGWSGSVGIAMAGVSGEGLIDAYGGKRRIESLDEKSSRYDYGFLFPLSKTAYTFQNNITIHAGGGLLDGGGIGISYLRADETRLAVVFPLFLGTDGKVWQDPYLTGKDRKKTYAKLESAIGFSARNILGSFASIGYDYQDLSVKNDRAGESFNNRLSSNEIKQLRRNSKSHKITVFLPSLTLGGGFYLIGGVSHTRTNAEGNANSFTSHSVDLTLAYKKRQVELFGQISGGAAEYRAVNPVFSTQRKDDSRAITGGITYWRPFNWKHSSLELVFVAERNSSNINFYDANTDLVTTGFNYYF